MSLPISYQPSFYGGVVGEWPRLIHGMDEYIYIYIYTDIHMCIYIYNMSSHTHGDSVWLAKLVKLDSTAAHGNRLRPSAAKAHTLQVAGSPQVPL